MESKTELPIEDFESRLAEYTIKKYGVFCDPFIKVKTAVEMLDINSERLALDLYAAKQLVEREWRKLVPKVES